MEKKTPKVKGKEVAPATETKDIAMITEVIQDKEIAPQDAFGRLNRRQVDLIKRTVAAGASDDELRLFIQVCKGANLNPFLRQAHLVPFWDSKAGAEKRTIIIGIDGFRAIAESSGAYAGSDDAVFEDGEQLEVEVWADKVKVKKNIEVPKKATVSVWKMVDHQRVAFTASARWSEYYPGGKKGVRWHVMPYLMLGKCAEALALRKAFPKLLSGMYEEAEFLQEVKGGEEKQRTATAFDKLMKVAKTMSAADLEDYKRKIEKSDKYTNEQKIEFRQLADERISALES